MGIGGGTHRGAKFLLIGRKAEMLDSLRVMILVVLLLLLLLLAAELEECV